MKITTPGGRTFEFGDNAEEKYANVLVSELLAAEKALADAKAAGVYEYSLHMKGLETGVMFAQMDLEQYQKVTQPGYTYPVYQPPEQADALSPDEQAIVKLLRQILRASAADREIYPDPATGEMIRSRAILKGEQQ